MKFRSSIALSAMAMTLVVPAVAQAKAPVKHHRAAASQGMTSNEQLQLAQQQIAQMQAQLNALQSKLEQSAAPAQVAQSQAQAQAAQEQAAVAVTKADKAIAIADQTKAAQAKTEKSVTQMAWAKDTKISGRMYFNFSNINQQASGQKTTGSGTGFDIKRMYIGIDHRFSKVFAFNVTTDVSNVVGSTSNYDYAQPSSFGSPVGRGFFIKKAYMEAKLSPALTIRAGSADLPWVANDENIYGYRHIENTIIDGPYGTSADWGIHALGNLGKYVDYQVAVINGAGYRNVKVTKSVDVEGRIGVNYNGVFADVGGYTGKRGAAVQGTPTYHTAQRFDAMAGFKNAKFTIGGEYFYAKNWNSVATLTEDRGEGFTVFGNYNIKPKWSVFGEYQWVKAQNQASAAGADVRQHYFNVGLQYEPVKILDLALVYKRDAVNNGNYSTNNGSYGSSFTTGIGCGSTVAKPCDGTYD
ncbi:MAG TPA: hypothetical protein VN222_08375, partial [Novosphingobium sp.]|nr:hypothetical protein [Novosphingobium sp.]